MQLPLDPNGQTTSTTGTTVKAGWFIASAIVVLLLWQIPTLQPLLKGVMILIILGLALRFTPNVISQIQNLGK